MSAPTMSALDRPTRDRGPLAHRGMHGTRELPLVRLRRGFVGEGDRPADCEERGKPSDLRHGADRRNAEHLESPGCVRPWRGHPRRRESHRAAGEDRDDAGRLSQYGPCPEVREAGTPRDAVGISKGATEVARASAQMGLPIHSHASAGPSRRLTTWAPAPTRSTASRLVFGLDFNSRDMSSNGPPSPTHPRVSPLAIWRIDRLPCCRIVFVDERLSSSALQRAHQFWKHTQRFIFCFATTIWGPSR